MFFSFSPLSVNPGAIAFTRMPNSPSSRASERLGREPLRIVLARHIARDAQGLGAQGLDLLHGRRRVGDVGHDHMPAFGRRPEAVRAPDALGASGDDDDLVFQSHGSSSLRRRPYSVAVGSPGSRAAVSPAPRPGTSVVRTRRLKGTRTTTAQDASSIRRKSSAYDRT